MLDALILVRSYKEALSFAEGGNVGNNDALLQGVAATEWHVEVNVRRHSGH